MANLGGAIETSDFFLLRTSQAEQITLVIASADLGSPGVVILGRA